jgi:cold shock CspA family protein
MSAVAKSVVREVLAVAGQISERVPGVVDDLPFRGVVYYLVPERNFGVILTADGLEVYFLRSSVMENDFDLLEPGSRVHFDLSASILGLQARRVRQEHSPSLCH